MSLKGTIMSANVRNNGWQFTVHNLSNQFYKCWPYSQLITCFLNLSIILIIPQECHQHLHFLYIQGSIFSYFTSLSYVHVYNICTYPISSPSMTIEYHHSFICETNKEAEKYCFQLIIVWKHKTTNCGIWNRIDRVTKNKTITAWWNCTLALGNHALRRGHFNSSALQSLIDRP